jgi:3-isopropylmalate dehydrogenase
MGYRIALIPGDGIGPDIAAATVGVLQALTDHGGPRLEFVRAEAGDGAAARSGEPLPAATLDTIRQADACLKAPVGETAKDVIVRLRQLFDLYANIRPARCYPGVPCLRPDVDLVIVRENTEDLYKGFEFDISDGAVGLRIITEAASLRIAQHAFQLAERRPRRHVVAVHKGNVLQRTDGVFARSCRQVAKRFPGIGFREMYVDTAAMNLIRQPQAFDVLVTTNVFGDILSDEAAQVVGGLGLAAGANVGDRHGLFEPVHGSAPDIAGQGVANPLAMVLAAKLMLEWLGQSRADTQAAESAARLERSVERVLQKDIKTPDLGGTHRTADIAHALVREVTA